MPSLALRRIPFTVEAENRLRLLKARTGMTRNVLCRIGFALSLEEPGRPREISKGVPAAREIDRYTLLGEYDLAYICLLTAWIKGNGFSADDQGQLDQLFVDHMNRGVELLSARIRSLGDMADLIPKG